MSKLSNKVAIVTGASKGIGAAIARHLAEAGAAVVVNYASSKEGADRVVAEITRQGGRAIAVQADVAKSQEIDRLFAETKKAFGRLDILVNNAGIYEFAAARGGHRRALPSPLRPQRPGRSCSLAGGSRAVRPGWRQHRQHQLGRQHADAAASVGLQRHQGGGRRGDPVPGQGAGAAQIRVNAINPGMIETEGVHAAGMDESDFRKQLEAQTPLGRIGQTQDIAPAVVFLASPDAGWITGETLVIGGGLR